MLASVLFVAIHVSGPIESLQEQVSRTSPGSEEIGYSKQEQLAFDFKIPKKSRPTFVFPGGCKLVGEATVTQAGGALTSTDGEPSSGQYRTLVDGSLLFATQDIGKSVTITASVVRRRVACLVYTPNSIDYTAELFHSAMQSKLAKSGVQFLDIADEAAWVRKLGVNVVRLAANNKLPAPELHRIAKQINSTAFLVADMDPEEYRSPLDPSIHRVSLNGVAVLYDLETGKLRSAFGSSYPMDVLPFESNRSARQRIVDQMISDLLYGLW